MNNAEAFYDNFTTKLIQDFLDGNRRAESAISFASNVLRRDPRTSILDLGCGIGWSTYEFSRVSPGVSTHGLDLSSSLISVAKKMFQENDSRRYSCVDLTETHWSGSRQGRYDACAMLDVYEHIPAESRPRFHRVLSSVLKEKAIVIMTCPTPLHQMFLRSQHPDGLQPVDEDVSLCDLQKLAADISAEVTHFEYKGIWATNDYFHAVLNRSAVRREPVFSSQPSELIPQRARMKYVEMAADLLGVETMAGLRARRRSLLKKAVARIRRAGLASWQRQP